MTNHNDINRSLLPALEDRLSEEELCEDAPNGPNVDSGRLGFPQNEHQEILGQ